MKMETTSVLVSAVALAVAGWAYLSQLEAHSTASSEHEQRPSSNDSATGLQTISLQSPQDDRIQQLVSHIKALEQRIEQLESAELHINRAGPDVQALAGPFIDPFEFDALQSDPERARQRLQELQTRAVDYSLSELERLQANRDWLLLASLLNRPEEIGPATDAILSIAQTSADGYVQRGAWEALVMAPGRVRLTEEFTNLATQNGDPELRRLGVQGLQTSLLAVAGETDGKSGDQEDILNTLQSIADNDPEQTVRAVAANALTQARRFREMLQRQSGGGEAGAFMMPMGGVLTFDAVQLAPAEEP